MYARGEIHSVKSRAVIVTGSLALPAVAVYRLPVALWLRNALIWTSEHRERARGVAVHCSLYRFYDMALA
jgi:hypothetical protein